MFVKYTRELFELLVLKGFVIANNEEHNNKITEDTKNIVLHKKENSIYYIVILSNMEKFEVNEFREFKKELAIKLNFSGVRVTCSKVLIINIFIGTEQPEILDQAIFSGEKYIDQFFYDVFWVLKEDNNKLIHRVSKKQPSDIIGIKKDIMKAFAKYKKSENKNKDLSMRDTINKIQSENPLKIVNRHTNVTFLFILICVLYFLILELYGGSTNIGVLLQFGALDNIRVLEYKEYYRMITSLFMHSGYIHLSFNLLALSIFGGRVERFMGSIHFILIFLLGGLFGNVLTIAFSDYVSVGASGSVFAMIGTLYAISKKYNKKLDGLDSNLFFMYILINICFGFLLQNINNIAHIGGLVFGLGVGVLYSPPSKFKEN